MTSTPWSAFAPRTLLLAALAALAVHQPARAEDVFASATFQEDLFLGSDGGGYTSGIFLSHMRIASEGEKGIEPTWVLKPIAKWLGMPQATLASFTVGQVIVTPNDLKLSPPDPQDAPYLGELLVRSANVYVHDNIADMFALSVGVVGPGSGAAETQRFAHRVSGSTAPQGWHSQVPNKLLLGVEGYRAWRFPFALGNVAGAKADAVVLGGGALGTIESSVGGTALLRYGTGLDRSFPTLARVTSRTGDPFAVGHGWFAYVGMSADRAFNQISLGNDRPDGNVARLRKTQTIVMGGVSYGWAKSSLTFSLQSASPLVDTNDQRKSWGSLTYSMQIP
jgi:hypothetical protein